MLALDGKGGNQGGKPYKTVDTKKKKSALKNSYLLKGVDPSRIGTMLPKGGSLRLHGEKRCRPSKAQKCGGKRGLEVA